MRLLAMVTDPKSVTRYLRGLGEPTKAPATAPARGPPYCKSRVLRRASTGDEAAEQARPDFRRANARTRSVDEQSPEIALRKTSATHKAHKAALSDLPKPWRRRPRLAVPIRASFTYAPKSPASVLALQQMARVLARHKER